MRQACRARRRRGRGHAEVGARGVDRLLPAGCDGRDREGHSPRWSGCTGSTRTRRARRSTASSARCSSAAKKASSRPRRSRAARRRGCCSAASCSRSPTCSLLDEPTNHLDLESINALNVALQKYEGTVLLVTHDQDLLEEVGTRVWHFEDGRIVDFKGTYEELASQLSTA